MRGLLPTLTAMLLPATAWAGGEVQILADVLLEQPETFEGGSLIGPPESRATWYSFGGIEPFEGAAMLAFSTGQAGADPLPGTDLGAVGADNDIAGLNLALRVPDDAHTMRFFVRGLAPAANEEPSVADDVIRVLVQGDPIALDPWTLGDLVPDSPAFLTARDHELQGTPYSLPGGSGTAWIEAVLPVQPGAQLAVRFEVRDGADDPLGDTLVLVDRLRFDAGVVEDVQPGPAPLLTAVDPPRIPEDQPSTVLLTGRTFPPDMTVEIIDEAGSSLTLADVQWRSAEQVELSLPGLDEGLRSIRLTWAGGALRWDEALEVDTPRPRITSLTPDVGPAAGGGLVSVVGSGFYDVTGLTLGGADVTELAVVSPERLDLVAPPGDPGTGDLELFAAGGFVEMPAAYTWSGAASDGDDDDDDPGGPTPLECSAAGRAPGSLILLALSVALTRKRRTGRPRPASR